MKNAILIVALLLSMNVIGQNSRPTFSPSGISSFRKHELNELTSKDDWRRHPGIAGHRSFKLNEHPAGRSLGDIQLLDSLVTWILDTATHTWVYESKSIFSGYDSNNNATNYTYLIWEEGAWLNDSKDESTFDANQNLILRLTEIWNGTAWENYAKSESIYNANNHITKNTYSLWESGDWEPFAQTLYAYDAGQNLVEVINQYWNGGSWDNESRNTYMYDANKNRTHTLIELWMGTDFQNYAQFEFTYDADNNLTLELFQFWNGSGWDNYELVEYVYDEDNYGISGLYQNWDGSTWVNNALYTNILDDNGNVTSTLVQYWVGFGWVNSAEYISAYNDQNYILYDVTNYYNILGTVIVDRDSSYFYYRSVTGIGDISETQKEIGVYPNPNDGQFTISGLQPLDRIEIYSPTGDPVFSFSALDSSTINELKIPHPAPGVYFAIIYYGMQFHAHKILIQ